MAVFYDQLWRQDKPPIEALRAAQLTLYHHPELAGELARARGTPDFDKLVQRPEPAPAAAGRGRAAPSEGLGGVRPLGLGKVRARMRNRRESDDDSGRR